MRLQFFDRDPIAGHVIVSVGGGGRRGCGSLNQWHYHGYHQVNNSTDGHQIMEIMH